jgi:hypothetical protein
VCSSDLWAELVLLAQLVLLDSQVVQVLLDRSGLKDTMVELVLAVLAGQLVRPVPLPQQMAVAAFRVAAAVVFCLVLVVHRRIHIVVLTLTMGHRLQPRQLVVAAVELVVLVVGLGAEQAVRALHPTLTAWQGAQEVLRVVTPFQVLVHHQVLLLAVAVAVGVLLVVPGR